MGSSSTSIVANSDDSTSSETDTDGDQGTATDTMSGEEDTDSYSDGETDSTTVFDSEGDTAIDVESSTVTIGASGNVTGGADSSSYADNDVAGTVTTVETDGENADDSSTDSSSEAGDSASDSQTSSESDTDNSTETDVDSGNETDTSSLALGTAGVIVSGTGYEYNSGSDRSNENDTDTGGSSDQDDEDDEDDVGGNTTSDSMSISETDTDSTSNSAGGTEQSSSTLNFGYGPGGLETGGTQTEGETDDESTTVTINDSSNDSDEESETDSDMEAADPSTDTISDTEDDADSDNETDTDSGSSGDDETIVLGAVMDELSGNSTASETDTATDSDTNVDTATTTASESSSYSETVGGETTTDSEVDESTETDTTTDTDDDTPTNSEESSLSTGVAGLVLSGSSTDTVDDTGTLGESDDDTDVDTSTETLSECTGPTASLYEEDETTDTESLTGSEDDSDTQSEFEIQDLGASGVVIGGEITSEDTANGSGTSSETGNTTTGDTPPSDYLDIVDDGSGDTGPTLDEDDTMEWAGSYTSSDSAQDDNSSYESTSETLGAGGVVAGGNDTESVSESSGTTSSVTETDDGSDDPGDYTDYGVGVYTEQDDRDSGTETLRDTDTSSSTDIETVSENIGADGVVTGGDESQTMDDSSADTTTETDDGTDTQYEVQDDPYVIPGVYSSGTLSETSTDTETDTESDEDWATETLGTSATISGGSDCFTTSDLDTSDYDSGTSGPEDEEWGSATATEEDSGSSSNLVRQTLGDILGAGAAISSGSLSYTDSTSDSDEETRTDSGASDDGTDVTTTILDDDTEYETGTETLGGGGTIDDGIASFSWSEGSSTDRDMTAAGYLDVNDQGTNTYGFGESGTESITTGGADSPGSVSFNWTQDATEDYVENEDIPGGTSTITGVGWISGSETYELTDTVSASWHDEGIDELTDDDSLAAETDDYTWDEYESFTADEINGTEAYVLDYTTGDVAFGGEAMATYSATDTGCDTLSADESHSDSLTLAAGTANYTDADLGTLDTSGSGAWTYAGETYGFSAANTTSGSEEQIASLSDSGSNSMTSYDDSGGASTNEMINWDFSGTDAGITDAGGGDECYTNYYENQVTSIEGSTVADQATNTHIGGSSVEINSSISDNGVSLTFDDDGYTDAYSDPFQGQDTYGTFSSFYASDFAQVSGTEFSDSSVTIEHEGESNLNTGNALSNSFSWSFNFDCTFRDFVP